MSARLPVSLNALPYGIGGMMGTAGALSVEHYLRTVYHPDRDYIDGEAQERNMGEVPHGWLQRFFTVRFIQHEAEWKLHAVPEVRVQVSPKRYRIPDVTVLSVQGLGTSIVTVPPALCIEIFSSDERMSRMLERVVDFQDMGVQAIWVVDPWRRVAYTARERGKLQVVEDALLLPNTPVNIAVAEIFADLDWLEQQSRL